MLDMRISLKKIDSQIRNNFDGKSITFITMDNTLSQTTLISNLGLLYARKGKKTLIIDTDFTHNLFPSVFNFDQDAGLYDMLKDDEQDYQKYIHQLSEDGSLCVLPSGEFQASNTENVLDNSYISKFYADIEESFDTILINLRPDVDTKMMLPILKISDGSVLITEMKLTKKRKLHRLIKEMLKNDQKIIGYVNVKRTTK